MNRRCDKEQLLAEVLADGSAGGFREGLLTETLGLVRSRRRARQTGRAVCALAVVAGLALVLWLSPGAKTVAPDNKSQPFSLVSSQPLAPAAIVHTEPFSTANIVSSSSSVQLVQTASSALRPCDITDNELLALVGSKPVALVRRAPHNAELIFVNEEDEERLFRN
jgi:hypothetical protein